MKTLKNQEGIALVTAILLSLISLVIILTALYFVMQGTRMSGLQKRYQTALEASHGGLDIFAKHVLPNAIANPATGLSSTQSSFLTALPASVTSDACFSEKLRIATKDWTVCNKTDLLNATASWDMKMTLKGEVSRPDYDIYIKIVETIPGNSDTGGNSEALIGHGVVDAGILTPQHFPYMYRIEIQGERQQNPDERAQLSVLYAY